jgi:type III secretory pathway component EscV
MHRGSTKRGLIDALFMINASTKIILLVSSVYIHALQTSNLRLKFP